VFLVAAEGVLRLIGYGFPASFFLRRGEVLVSNQQFGWRFFPPQIARDPLPTLVSGDKPDGVYRVFVLGGSAAMGIPDPTFSFGRILEVALETSYPDRRFEVHNLAMTAINSHVVRVIAHESARLQPDLLIVYLGNNEVVGPYGAGTVFPGSAGRLGVVRLSIRVRGTRLGQMMEALLRRPWIDPSGSWEGMEMFVGHRVAAGDPRLDTTYGDLHANLTDIADAAAESGVPLLVSTVAVNLADSPPFGSAHRPGLREADRLRFVELFDMGEELAAAGDHTGAAAAFRGVLELDEEHADAHYRFAQSLLEIGETDDATRHFVAARDLDALRFRADSRINDTIREAAGAHKAMHLVDAERALAGAPESIQGIPGDDLFWEHVHLRFAGNYRLALAFLGELRDLLGAPTGSVPTEEECRDRLAFTPWDRRHSAWAMLSMMSKPPFDSQLDHAKRIGELRSLVAGFHEQSREAMDDSERRHRDVVVREPGDLLHRARLAEILHDHERYGEEAGIWRALLEDVPDTIPWLSSLGFAELESGNHTEAIAIMERAIGLRPRVPGAHINLGTALRRAGNVERAEASFRRAIEIDPNFEPARIELVSLLTALGRLGDAEDEYRKALGIDRGSAEAHFGLGSLLERQGRLDDAAAEYRLALAAGTGHAKAGNNLGLVLEQLGRPKEAELVYRRTIELTPRHAMTHFNLADLLLDSGRAAEALDVYRTALDLQPDNMQARLNAAICLQLAGRPQEAAAAFRETLRLAPDSVETRLRLAMLLATADDPGVRDPAEAARLAAEASGLTNNRVPEVLEAVAQVYAVIGSRDLARATFARALEIARTGGQTEIAQRIEAQLRALE
jgi:tetratricopeptide (TPR) repeat protein